MRTNEIPHVIPNAQQRLDTSNLRGFASRVLRKKGVEPLHASTAAEILVRTSMRGFESHGVWLLPLYADLIDAGGIVSSPDITIDRVAPAASMVDGGGGIGPVVAHTAMLEGIDIARRTGIGIVTVRNSNHFGAAGHYALMAAEAGLIGIVTSNAPPYMTIFNSRGPVMGNQPLAYGVPMGNGSPPVVFDVSMSKIAGRKVFMAAERGIAIPQGWIVDRTGRATTDPSQLSTGGSLLPFGAHKGSGLAILTEVLAGVLSGGSTTTDVIDFMKDPTTPSRIGHTMIVIEPRFFGGSSIFGSLHDLAEDLRAAPVIAGDAPIRLPGDAAAVREERAAREGLRVTWEVWVSLRTLAGKNGLETLLCRSLINPKT